MPRSQVACIITWPGSSRALHLEDCALSLYCRDVNQFCRAKREGEKESETRAETGIQGGDIESLPGSCLCPAGLSSPDHAPVPTETSKPNAVCHRCWEAFLTTTLCFSFPEVKFVMPLLSFVLAVIVVMFWVHCLFKDLPSLPIGLPPECRDDVFTTFDQTVPGKNLVYSRHPIEIRGKKEGRNPTYWLFLSYKQRKSSKYLCQSAGLHHGLMRFFWP